MRDSINDGMRPVICIAGPTASGKSEWAVNLAKAAGGEIINADALQVYSDLQILSARPAPAEMGGIAHHLYGFVDGAQRYSVGQWLRDVQPVILDILARGKLPILVGGTGLYFKALTEGMAFIPPPSAAGMAYARLALDKGIDNLRRAAEKLDPVATARVLGDDPQRLLRIVSVAKGTRRPLSVWQTNTRPVIPSGYWRGAARLPDRAGLYDKINSRYENMLAAGGLDEARRVMDRGLGASLPMMKAVGLPPLLSFLRGEISYERAVELAQRDTRRFAKRQLTWLRGQCLDWEKINSKEAVLSFNKNIKNSNALP